jgi:predicted TIM-barrel fold metal-dependent hydrolase
MQQSGLPNPSFPELEHVQQDLLRMADRTVMKMPARIVDAHLHFYDYTQNRHVFPEQDKRGYAALTGHHSPMPTRYLPTDYLDDIRDYNVEGVVWHEFLSTDPYREAEWAQRLATASGLRHALVARVDFLAADLEATLERYAQLPRVTAVREHMACDEANPLRRLVKRPDLLRDPVWRSRLRLAQRYGYRCGIEVFAHQLPDLIRVVRGWPEIGFTVALMGWPIDLSCDGFRRWKRSLADLAACDNICVDISALECIFGYVWSVDEAAPWITTAIETIGVSRCMFGSHMPIGGLATGFTELYGRYAQLVAGYSDAEIDELFFGVANRWFSPA